MRGARLLSLRSFSGRAGCMAQPKISTFPLKETAHHNFNNFSKVQEPDADRHSDASATKGVLGSRRVRAFELEDYLCKQE
jgi:hypothetical protein